MEVRRSALQVVSRFELATIRAGFRRTFYGLTDKLMLAILLGIVLFGVRYGIRRAAEPDIAKHVAWLVLLTWPVSYLATKAAGRRLNWLEECTPLCAEALRGSVRWTYRFVPIGVVGLLFVIAVALLAPGVESKILFASLSTLAVLAGATHALVWSTKSITARPLEIRSELPRVPGRQLFMLLVMRSQLYGMPPTKASVVALGSGLFCFIAAASKFADRDHAVLFAAGITALSLIAFSRADFHISKCAPKIGVGPMTVMVAHGVLPLGIVIIATSSMLLSVGLSKVFLVLAWSTWAMFYTMAVLRALRYPRYGKQSAELRLIGDFAVLAALGTLFVPLVIPGLLIIIIHGAVAHRRLLWMMP